MWSNQGPDRDDANGTRALESTDAGEDTTNVVHMPGRL